MSRRAPQPERGDLWFAEMPSDERRPTETPLGFYGCTTCQWPRHEDPDMLWEAMA